MVKEKFKKNLKSLFECCLVDKLVELWGLVSQYIVVSYKPIKSTCNEPELEIYKIKLVVLKTLI